MRRRSFLTAAMSGPLAATGLAAPALASSQPDVHWRLISSVPRSLDAIFSANELIAKTVSEATEGRFRIETFAAGEIVPGLLALDAAQNGTVEAAQTPLYYYFGKSPTFACFAGVPFGLNARQQNAWLYNAGGLALQNRFLARHNVIGFPAGNTGAQMGGWFRNELSGLDAFLGLKIRIGGLAGEIMRRLGAVPQQVAAGDIYAALERGVIDACEWTGPYDDEKLGFVKVAPYYYFPGWWDGGTVVHVVVNSDAWARLPGSFRTVFTAAAGLANMRMLANYDAGNPPALGRLVASGARLRAFPQAFNEAGYQAATEVYAEIGSTDHEFQEAMEALIAFRDQEYRWWRFSEFAYDDLMIRRLMGR